MGLGPQISRDAPKPSAAGRFGLLSSAGFPGCPITPPPPHPLERCPLGFPTSYFECVSWRSLCEKLRERQAVLLPELLGSLGTEAVGPGFAQPQTQIRVLKKVEIFGFLFIFLFSGCHPFPVTDVKRNNCLEFLLPSSLPAFMIFGGNLEIWKREERASCVQTHCSIH